MRRNYTTKYDNQTSAPFQFMRVKEKELMITTSWEDLGLSGIPPAPKGVAQIKVCFEIDANGILTVSAEEIEEDTVSQLCYKSKLSFRLIYSSIVKRL
jgi:molecular chaperone DnaK (HSP70)